MMAGMLAKTAAALLALAAMTVPAAAQLLGIGAGARLPPKPSAALDALAPELMEAKADLGDLPRLVGKSFINQNCTVVFDVAPDGRYRIGFCNSQYHLIGRDESGVLQPKLYNAGGPKFPSIFEAGPSGFVFGDPRMDTRTYFLRDADGNFDLVTATLKPDDMRLDVYMKMFDPTNPQAAAAGAGIPVYVGKKFRPAVEKLVGYSLDELPGKVKEPLLFGGPVVAPPRPQSRPVIVAQGRQQPAVAPPRPAVAAGPRLALVMGNNLYGPATGMLKNPVNDARAISAALRSVGFQVIAVDNADQRAMKRAIIDFGNRLRALGPKGTGLFYYAGHGVQAHGANYLVPVDARIAAEADLEVEAVAADGVLRQMEQAGISTNIVILDACRNLPVQRASRDGTRGLARMDAPNGSFMAYSTAPGAVAMDGKGVNSPFTTALITELKRPGQAIEETFRQVRRAVIAQTGGAQVPWDSSSLLDGFVFAPDGGPAEAPAASRRR